MTSTTVDVKDAPWNAKGDIVTDDTAAIQGAVDYMYNNYNGGLVFVPPGNYLTRYGIVLKGGVILQASGPASTMLQVGDYDVNCVTFDASCFNASIRDLFVVGKKTRPVGTHAVVVAPGVPISIRDSYLWYGYSGLFTKGVDGYHENCFIAGLEAGIVSNGANWYMRCKVDSVEPQVPKLWGLLQGAVDNVLLENHFTQCDFSGDFNKAVQINDTSLDLQSITTFEGCAFGAPVNIGRARATIVSASEIGHPSFTVAAGSPTIVTGSYAFSPMTIANAVKSANLNIT